MSRRLWLGPAKAALGAVLWSCPRLWQMPLAAAAEPTCLEDVARVFPELMDKLHKGLAVTLEHQVARDDQPPVVFGCKVYYDLWSERYAVTSFHGAEHQLQPAVTVVQLTDVWRLCNQAQSMGPPGTVVTVTSRLNPVSDEQVAKTSQWLATKGINNSGSGALLGRALGAMIDLKQERAVTRPCRVGVP